MTALREIDEVTARIESETLALQLHLATRMIWRATLELRYAGQPRLPTGDPGGGQYTFGPAGTDDRPRSLVAQRMGRQTFSGRLVSQQPTSVQGPLLCTYYDSRADYHFTVPVYADKCPSVYLNY